MNTEHQSLGKQDSQLLDEAEKLIWALLDEQINDDDIKHLELLIKENEAVRLRYLQCVQVHTDLYTHYQTAPADPKSPVLGTLLGDLSLPHSDPSSLVD